MKIFFLISVLIGMLLALGCKGYAEEGRIYISPAEWMLGEVKQGEVYQTELLIENRGQGILIIDSVMESCECVTVQQGFSNSIHPDQSISIIIELDTAGMEGEFKKFVYIESSDSENPTKVFKITGIIVDAVTSATELIFKERYNDISDERIEFVEPADLRKWRAAEEVIVVDVRRKERFERGHIKGALSIPLLELEKRINELPKDKKIAVYCGDENCPLSKWAVQLLLTAGFKEIYELKGGFRGWQETIDILE